MPTGTALLDDRQDTLLSANCCRVRACWAMALALALAWLMDQLDRRRARGDLLFSQVEAVCGQLKVG
jgi:hypothetical protein